VRVKRGKRLIHEQDFGSPTRARAKADALFHAAGEFFRVGAFEAIEADVSRMRRARLWRSMAGTPRASSGASTLSSTVSREQGNSGDDGHAAFCDVSGFFTHRESSTLILLLCSRVLYYDATRL